MHFERVELGFGGLIYWLVSIEEKEEERVDEELRKNWKRAAFYRDSWRFLSEAISFSFPLSSSCQIPSNEGEKTKPIYLVRPCKAKLCGEESPRSLEAKGELDFLDTITSLVCPSFTLPKNQSSPFFSSLVCVRSRKTCFSKLVARRGEEVRLGFASAVYGLRDFPPPSLLGRNPSFALSNSSLFAKLGRKEQSLRKDESIRPTEARLL